MKAKITFLLCLCLVMSLCVMGHRQGIKHPTCEFCGLWKAKCQYHGDHPCGQCSQKFSTQSQMAAHKAKVHPAPTFNCTQCGQKFNTQALLNAHKAKAHPAPTFNCTQCGQKFNTQALLNAHKAKAHPAPTFNCNQCTQKFNTKAQLDAHKAKAHAVNVKPKNQVTKKDIEETTEFVLSESNGLYIAIPYTITITSNNAHIEVEASREYPVSKSYPIDEKAYENFKQKLIEAQIHTEKDEYSAAMPGAGSTQLKLYKNGKCYFNHNTGSSEEYLTYSGFLHSLFWDLIPKSLDELLDEPDDFDIDSLLDELDDFDTDSFDDVHF